MNNEWCRHTMCPEAINVCLVDGSFGDLMDVGERLSAEIHERANDLDRVTAALKRRRLGMRRARRRKRRKIFVQRGPLDDIPEPAA